MTSPDSFVAGERANSIFNLSVRIFQRVLQVPFKGLPKPQTCREPFDEAHGVHTSGIVWLTSLRHKNFSHGIRYEPCTPERCNWLIRNAGIDTKGFAFIDIGCGKGRPLIIASDNGFNELIGVEYSRKLCEIARGNLQGLGIKAQIICQDATEFEIPDRDIFVFLFHPFDAVVLRKVLANLPSRRRVVVAYDGDDGGVIAEGQWLKPYAAGDGMALFRNF